MSDLRDTARTAMKREKEVKNMRKKLVVGICDRNKTEVVRVRDEFCRCMAVLGEPEAELHLFCNGRELYESSRTCFYDLIFVDLVLPEMDGMELARLLGMNHRGLRIVFVSAQEDRVFDTYECMPLWFVRKNRLSEDMPRAVNKYFQVTAPIHYKLRTKEGFRYRNVVLGDILYIECSGHTLTVQLTDRAAYHVYGSLKPVEEELSGYGFLRIHKNYLVNLQYVREVGNRTLMLYNGTELDLGINRKKVIIEAVEKYQKRMG